MSNSDSELDEDEEEILVYVEFDNCATNDVFGSENLKLDMLGLDSDHPVMQVNGKFFEGSYEDAVGTFLFFEKDNNPTIDDPVFDKVATMKYFNKTRKLLKMQRAFVLPRYEVVGDSEHSKSIPNLETIKDAGVPSKYHNEALSFWTESRNKRISALHQYLRKQEFRKELRMRGFEPESESDEDNPFAMYKYLDNESDVNKVNENGNTNNDYELQIEKLENTLQNTELDNKNKDTVHKKLTVIDPGPSTSKSSMPWIDDVPKADAALQKVKSVGKVRKKTIKEKIPKKVLRKRKLSLSQKSTNENSQDEILNKNELCELKNNSVNTNNETFVDDDVNSEKSNPNIAIVSSEKVEVEEMEIDEVAIADSNKLLLEEIKNLTSNKKKTKQEKREAKMKEISEKLKALNQCSSHPNS